MRAKLDNCGLWLTTGVLALLCMAPSGCKKAGSSEAPQMDAYAGGEAERDPDPLAELAALEGRMRAMGLPAASTKLGATTDAASSEAGAAEDEATDTAVEEAPAPSEAHTAPPPSGPARQPPGQDACADVCSLSESICTLEVRICSLSESHGDDPVYIDACERAIEDCDVAGDACNGCRG